MAEYLSPAVYFEELSSGIKPLEGAGTSTAGFVGLAARGPIGTAVPINNFTEFQKNFGDFSSDALLPFSVNAFFNEGGGTCYVVRTCHYDNADRPTAISANRVYKAVGDAAADALKVEASSAGAWANGLAIIARNPDAATFELEVFQNGRSVETISALSMDRSSRDYAETRINGISPFIKVTDVIAAGSALNIAGRRPAPTAGAVPDPLQSGDDGLSGLSADDYIGKPSIGNGLNAFNAVDGLSIIAVPEAVDRNVHVRATAYCESRQDCFYIADCQPIITAADDVLNYKTADGLFAGGNAASSKFSALYAPWIEVFDPRTNGRIAIPPSGAIAGRYADVDRKRGVHKAPAGIVDGKLKSALGLTFGFVQADQEKLNPAGINLIRSLPGAGPVIWGARTTSSDPEQRYVNVRRLLIFLRESILDGTSWAIFEPNDRSLWKSLERNIAAFLRLQWLNGALVGATADQAFYVKCDDETNPPESVLLGRVITEIGVAPSKPAEFVIFRIAQSVDGGA
ncbi:phage tail sheath family protein [Bradyrhizobium sp. HKCCYLS20291]|uniref:phage tail sheath family protein n=1 Tax=Bradyrhizobium sp. HKCCYLS20291 TaxID=3420766 RepID=UPI003EB7C024